MVGYVLMRYGELMADSFYVSVEAAKEEAKAYLNGARPEGGV